MTLLHIIVILSAVVVAESCGNPKMTRVGEHCYLVSTDKNTVRPASNLCKKLNVKLVSFEKLDELHAVAHQMLRGMEKQDFWTSAKYSHGKWVWRNKAKEAPVLPDFWCDGRPNDDVSVQKNYGKLVFVNGKWCLKNAQSDKKIGYICEGRTPTDVKGEKVKKIKKD